MKGKVRELVEDPVERMYILIKVVHIAASPYIKDKDDPRELTCVVLRYNFHQRNV